MCNCVILCTKNMFKTDGTLVLYLYIVNGYPLSFDRFVRMNWIYLIDDWLKRIEWQNMTQLDGFLNICKNNLDRLPEISFQHVHTSLFLLLLVYLSCFMLCDVATTSRPVPVAVEREWSGAVHGSQLQHTSYRRKCRNGPLFFSTFFPNHLLHYWTKMKVAPLVANT